MKNLKRRRASRCEAGAALVELAVSLPVLVIVLVGTADFARALYMSIELTNAARAGAQYGAYKLSPNSKDLSGMQTTAVAASPNLSGVSATASRFCQCATDSGVFSSLAGGTTCDDAPTASCPGLHRVTTVTVTTSATFTLLAGNVGIRTTLPLSRTATLRVAE